MLFNNTGFFISVVADVTPQEVVPPVPATMPNASSNLSQPETALMLIKQALLQPSCPKRSPCRAQYEHSSGLPSWLYFYVCCRFEEK